MRKSISRLPNISTVRRYDTSLQYRTALNPATVQAIADTLSVPTDIKKPLVVGLVDGTKYLLAGYHRLEAARVAGLTQIPVEEIEFDSIEAARAYAVSDNVGSTASDIVDIAIAAYDLNKNGMPLDTVIGLPSWCRDLTLYYNNLIKLGSIIRESDDIAEDEMNLRKIMQYLRVYESKSPQWYYIANLPHAVLETVYKHYAMFPKEISDKKLLGIINSSGVQISDILNVYERYNVEGVVNDKCIDCKSAIVFSEEFMGNTTTQVQCYNKSCITTKIAFDIMEYRIAFEKGGHDLVAVVENGSAYNKINKDFLNVHLNMWKRVSPKNVLSKEANCISSHPALIIDGRDWYTTNICTNKKCTEHGLQYEDNLDKEAMERKIKKEQKKAFETYSKWRHDYIVEMVNSINFEDLFENEYLTVMEDILNVTTANPEMNLHVKKILNEEDYDMSNVFTYLFVDGFSKDQQEYYLDKYAYDFDRTLYDTKEEEYLQKMSDITIEIVKEFQEKAKEKEEFVSKQQAFIKQLNPETIKQAAKDENYKATCKLLGLSPSNYKTMHGRTELKETLKELMNG